MSNRFGLLGETLGYSLSPKIHHAIYDALGITATYELVEIPRDTFAGELTRMKLKKLDGFNVTIPYKELIIPLLDDIDLAAARIGAVNTVLNTDGAFKGYNTDYYGFMTCIQDLGIENRSRVTILGTGGAAKMAVVALEDLGFEEIVIVSRDPEKARLKFYKHTCMDYASFNHQSMVSDLLVNCTPMGQNGSEMTETIENEALKRQGVLFDLNYNPAVTPLLEQGYKLGMHGINGLKMLIAQAVKAEEIWLDRPLPIEALFSEVEKNL
jgi:shikimate dehydrogenase